MDKEKQLGERFFISDKIEVLTISTQHFLVCSAIQIFDANYLFISKVLAFLDYNLFRRTKYNLKRLEP